MSDHEQRAVDLVRNAWADAVAESPAAARARDVGAAARFAERAQRGRARSFTFGLAGGLAVAAIVAVILGRREAPAIPAPALVTVVTPSAPLPTAPTAPAVSAPAEAPKPAAIVRSCNACKRKEDVIEVPSGSKLLFAFSLDAAFAEPEKGVTVEGPAHARSDEHGIVILDGRARVHASRDARVRTPTLTTASDDARYTIDVDGDETRISVASGHVTVTMPSGETRVLTAGETWPERKLDTKPDAPAREHQTKPEAKAEPKKSADERWASAKSALESGDRPRAESELRTLVAEVDGSHPLYARASFRLAELELARGATLEARPRLASLLSANDPQLAEDAATLYARSYPTPGERANAWAVYLATNPASPRRERAMLERIRALTAAGRASDARSATAELCVSRSASCTTARDVVARLP